MVFSFVFSLANAARGPYFASCGRALRSLTAAAVVIRNLRKRYTAVTRRLHGVTRRKRYTIGERQVHKRERGTQARERYTIGDLTDKYVQADEDSAAVLGPGRRLIRRRKVMIHTA